MISSNSGIDPKYCPISNSAEQQHYRTRILSYGAAPEPASPEAELLER